MPYKWIDRKYRRHLGRKRVRLSRAWPVMPGQVLTVNDQPAKHRFWIWLLQVYRRFFGRSLAAGVD